MVDTPTILFRAVAARYGPLLAGFHYAARAAVIAKAASTERKAATPTDALSSSSPSSNEPCSRSSLGIIRFWADASSRQCSLEKSAAPTQGNYIGIGSINGANGSGDDPDLGSGDDAHSGNNGGRPDDISVSELNSVYEQLSTDSASLPMLEAPVSLRNWRELMHPHLFLHERIPVMWRSDVG